jgi:hypothetical protein
MGFANVFDRSRSLLFGKIGPRALELRIVIDFMPAWGSCFFDLL